MLLPNVCLWSFLPKLTPHDRTRSHLHTSKGSCDISSHSSHVGVSQNRDIFIHKLPLKWKTLVMFLEINQLMVTMSKSRNRFHNFHSASRQWLFEMIINIFGCEKSHCTLITSSGISIFPFQAVSCELIPAAQRKNAEFDQMNLNLKKISKI